jgi:hypothetical protein
VEADESCRQLLVQLSSELAQLCAVLAALAAASETLTQQGLQDLHTRQNVTGLVLLYTQVTGTEKTSSLREQKREKVPTGELFLSLTGIFQTNFSSLCY